MENLNFKFKTAKPATSKTRMTIAGVVASGNLEVLIEDNLAPDACIVDVKTASHGFAEVWQAVLDDFMNTHATGGLRISINDGGARPDTVLLRLAQAMRLLEETEQ